MSFSEMPPFRKTLDSVGPREHIAEPRAPAIRGSRCSPPAAERGRYAAFDAVRRILCDGGYRPDAGIGRHRGLTGQVTK
jgi:hypothetical protein